MSPTVEQIRIPDRYSLTKRPTCQPTDERPMLRDEDGRCRAVVELWRPDAVPN